MFTLTALLASYWQTDILLLRILSRRIFRDCHTRLRWILKWTVHLYIISWLTGGGVASEIWMPGGGGDASTARGGGCWGLCTADLYHESLFPAKNVNGLFDYLIVPLGALMPLGARCQVPLGDLVNILLHFSAPWLPGAAPPPPHCTGCYHDSLPWGGGGTLPVCPFYLASGERVAGTYLGGWVTWILCPSGSCYPSC